jgi:carbon monoxide dehydrogenase subunit G
MVEYEGTYEFQCDKRTVFRCISSSQNLCSISPSLQGVETVRQVEDGTEVVQTEYEVSYIPGEISGTAIVKQEEKKEQNLVKYSIEGSEMDCEITIRLSDDQGSTVMYYNCAYEVGFSVPDVLLSSFGKEIKKGEMDGIVNNIKSDLSSRQ